MGWRLGLGLGIANTSAHFLISNEIQIPTTEAALRAVSRQTSLVRDYSFDSNGASPADRALVEELELENQRLTIELMEVTRELNSRLTRAVESRKYVPPPRNPTLVLTPPPPRMQLRSLTKEAGIAVPKRSRVSFNDGAKEDKSGRLSPLSGAGAAASAAGTHGGILRAPSIQLSDGDEALVALLTELDFPEATIQSFVEEQFDLQLLINHATRDDLVLLVPRAGPRCK